MKMRPLNMAWIILIGQLLLALALIALPYRDLFINGPFAWHIHQLPFTQGGIEALVLLALCIAINLPNRYPLLRGIGLLIVGLVYLRLHYIDVPLLVAFLYMEALGAIGAFALSPWRKCTEPPDFALLTFLCGIAIGALLITFLSLMNLATPFICYTVVVALGLVCAFWKRTSPLILQISRSGITHGLSQRLTYSCLYATVLVMAAKIHLIADFDSMWYGLRTQFVLEQGGSIFANLGLAHFVYYYPKLYEILILPLCGFGDAGFPAAFNVFIYIVLLAVVYEGGLALGISKSYAALSALAVGWTPVAVSTVLLVKPDFLTATILLIAFFYSVRAVAQLNLAYSFVAISALFIALAGKLVSIPFGGMLAICFFVSLAYKTIRVSCKNQSLAAFDTRIKYGKVILPIGIAVLIAISYRTYYLTGLPIIEPGFLVHWLSYLGFHPHFPYSPVYIGETWHFKLTDMLDWIYMIIEPSKLPQIVFTWTGNLFALTTLMAFISIRKWRGHASFATAFIFSVILFVFALLFIAFYGDIPGGDGNYYIFPIVAITAVTVASYQYLPPSLRNSSVIILLLLMLFHAVVWFATSPLWKTGTSAFKLDFTHSIFTSDLEAGATLKQNGLLNISQALRAAYNEGRCTALADGTVEALFQLPCAVEETWLLIGKKVEPQYVGSPNKISQYIINAHFDFIIVTNSAANTPLAQVFDIYATLPGVVEIDDTLYKALDLRGVKTILPVVPTENKENNSRLPPIVLANNNIIKYAKIENTSEIVEPWRKSVSLENKPLKEYLYGQPAIIIRNGGGINFPWFNSIACPTILSFRLGLLPTDQVLHRQTRGLLIEVVNNKTNKTLESTTLDVPSIGFKREQWEIKQCRQANITLRLYAIPQNMNKPASLVLADPELVRRF